MASIHKETALSATPDDAWDALRDWPALHERLVPGFVVDARAEGEDRIVTFFTGMELRERIVSVDDDARRLAWSIVDGPYEHHHASAQVIPDGEGGCRFVWIADVLPHAAAERTSEMMEKGTAAVRTALGGS